MYPFLVARHAAVAAVAVAGGRVELGRHIVAAAKGSMQGWRTGRFVELEGNRYPLDMAFAVAADVAIVEVEQRHHRPRLWKRRSSTF